MSVIFCIGSDNLNENNFYTVYNVDIGILYIYTDNLRNSGNN